MPPPEDHSGGILRKGAGRLFCSPWSWGALWKENRLVRGREGGLQHLLPSEWINEVQMHEGVNGWGQQLCDVSRMQWAGVRFAHEDLLTAFWMDFLQQTHKNK